jgi:TRAP-type C4-dicarboxylate transport system permease small subunit
MRKLNKLFDTSLYWSTAVFAMLFFGIVVVSIITRYLLRTPILASIELSRLFFVWSAFLAAAITYRQKAHVGLTFLYEKFSEKVQLAVSLLMYLSILAFLAVVLYQSLVVIQLLWQTDLPMLDISQSWLYIPLPIISICMISYTLEFIADLFQKQEGHVS